MNILLALVIGVLLLVVVLMVAPKMKLLPQWRRLLRKAWSMRLMLFAGLLTGCEAIINVIPQDDLQRYLPVPAWARALLILGVIGGAFVARLLAQKDISDAS